MLGGLGGLGAAAAPQQRKRALDLSLRLDSMGRQLDASGQVVQLDASAVRSLKVNVAPKKKANPYLAHLETQATAQDEAAASETGPAAVGASGASGAGGGPRIDPRIKVKSRALRGKKSFAFHKEGVFVRQDELLAEKDAKKAASGLTSGRNKNAYEQTGMDVDPLLAKELELAKEALRAKQSQASRLPPRADLAVPVHQGLDHGHAGALAFQTSKPAGGKGTGGKAGSSKAGGKAKSKDSGKPEEVEWWDLGFLPLEKRSDPKATYDDALPQGDDGGGALMAQALGRSKFHALVLHPAALLPPGAKAPGEAEPPPQTVFLTSKERKRIRRQTREERRNEERDKIALGLLPPPEPKLKLANFMKVPFKNQGHSRNQAGALRALVHFFSLCVCERESPSPLIKAPWPPLSALECSGPCQKNTKNTNH